MKKPPVTKTEPFESKIKSVDMPHGCVLVSGEVSQTIASLNRLGDPKRAGKFVDLLIKYVKAEEPNNPCLKFFEMVRMVAVEFRKAMENDPEFKAMMEAEAKRAFLAKMLGNVGEGDDD